MVQFSIGDKVVHPIHGSGLITGVEHQELVEGFEHYYVLEIAGKGLTVFVPMRNAGELGVRSATSRAGLVRVLDVLRAEPTDLAEDHKTRQSRAQEKLTSGSLIQVAEVVRDLTWHERLDHLTMADSRLLDQGRDLLASEMALVTDNAVEHARQIIDAALAPSTPEDSDQEADALTHTVSDAPLDAEAKQEGLMDALKRHTTEALGLRAN